jgi:hypothetical protein
MNKVTDSAACNEAHRSEEAEMASRQWTVVVVSDDDTAVRQFRLSREALRILIALGLFLVAGLTSLATAFVVGAGAGRADARLIAKNEILERELEGMTVKLDTLESSLAQLTSKDEYYRLLAGLEPLDDEIHLAGIGGPDGDRSGIERSVPDRFPFRPACLQCLDAAEHADPPCECARVQLAGGGGHAELQARATGRHTVDFPDARLHLEQLLHVPHASHPAPAAAAHRPRHRCPHGHAGHRVRQWARPRQRGIAETTVCSSRSITVTAW